MPDLKNVYTICGHLSKQKQIVRDNIVMLRDLLKNWNNTKIVTDSDVEKFKELFGINGCLVAVGGSEFSKKVLETYKPVFIIIPKIPVDDNLVVEMDIENVENDSWVSVPYG